MLFFKKKEEAVEALSAEIMAVTEEMAIEHADTETYAKMADNLEKLCRAKENLEKCKVDNNDLKVILAKGGVLVLCIGSILIFEGQDNIIRTKALSLLPKMVL